LNLIRAAIRLSVMPREIWGTEGGNYSEHARFGLPQRSQEESDKGEGKKRVPLLRHRGGMAGKEGVVTEEYKIEYSSWGKRKIAGGGNEIALLGTSKRGAPDEQRQVVSGRRDLQEKAKPWNESNV